MFCWPTYSMLLMFFSARFLVASDDPESIVMQWIESQNRNQARARQYTFVEQTDHFTYGSKQELRKDRSETHEVIFVEGMEYKKLVARNGKPLDERERMQAEKEMRRVAEERRKRRGLPSPGGRVFFGNQSVDLGSREELLVLFENRLIGEESVSGRKAWVIESTPKATALTEHEKQVACFRKKVWIDQAEYVALRHVFTVQCDRLFAIPGSTITFEYGKISADTWHETLIVLDILRVRNKSFQPSGRTEYRQSGFKKFDVKSTISAEVPRH